MFHRIGQVIESGAGLFQARARIAVHDLKAAGAVAASYVAAAIIAAAGACTLLAALSIVLAERLGWPVALAIVGGAALLLAVIVLLVAGWRPGGQAAPDREDLEAEAARCKVLLHQATSPEPHHPSAARDHNGFAADLLGLAKSNPQLVASSAFAIVAVLGARRTFRLIRTAAAAAGVVASVSKSVGKIQEVAALRATAPHRNGSYRGGEPD